MSTDAKAIPSFVEKKIVGDVLILTYGNGKVLTLDISQLPAEQIQNHKMHGASQKYGDVSARYTKERDYAGAIKHTTALWEANMANSWTVKATAVPKEKILSDEELLEAFAKAMKLPHAKAQPMFETLTAEYRAMMRDLPEIKVAWREIEVAKEKANLTGKPSTLADLMASLKPAPAA
jgi:type II secretory pathway component HofQ